MAGFSNAPEVDVGDAFVLPGFIDMHNHLAYNALPLWCRARPDRAVAAQQALARRRYLHRIDHRTGVGLRQGVSRSVAWLRAGPGDGRWRNRVCRAGQPRTVAIGPWSATSMPRTREPSSDDLIYTSVVTKTGEPLATAVRRMGDGSGFIYHCSEGQRGSRVLRDYTDLKRAEGLLPTLIGIHCCAVDAGNWTKWAAADAGGVVWSPLSNLVLYAQTTLVDDVRARGVRVCLGSDWGPSGTKNLLGEMKVARIAADQFGYTVTDAEIVEMVTSNPGALLERCWRRPVGRLVQGRVRRRHRGSRPRPRQSLEADRRRDRARRRARGHQRRPQIRRRQADEPGRSATRRSAMTVGGRGGGSHCPTRPTRRRRGRGPRSWPPSKPSSAIRRRRSPLHKHVPHRDPALPRCRAGVVLGHA